MVQYMGRNAADGHPWGDILDDYCVCCNDCPVSYGHGPKHPGARADVDVVTDCGRLTVHLPYSARVETAVATYSGLRIDGYGAEVSD